MPHLRIKILTIALLMLCMPLAAQITGISGIIYDAQTGEPIPFAQILFQNTGIGTTSDLNGKFRLVTTEKHDIVEFRMVGYKTFTLTLKRGRILTNQKINLENDNILLEDVVVRPERKQKEKYRRKGNPAVELMRNVIAHKYDNRLVSEEAYSCSRYEKMTFSFDPFTANPDSSRFWRDFKFINDYLDESRFDSAKSLIFSIRENLYDQYYTRSPHRERNIRKASRWEGLDKLLGSNNLTINIGQIIQPVNIFQNDVNLLLNRFPSPLSTNLGISYYQYYLQDTILLEGDSCIDLAFVPVNSENYAFSGHLYIVKDSTYALKRCRLTVPINTNMNWVKGYEIEQTFNKLDNGKWVTAETHAYTRFAVSKKSRRTICAHQQEVFSNYQIGNRVDERLFIMAGNTIDGDSIKLYKNSDWAWLRPQPLTQKEIIIDSLVPAMMTVPKFRLIVNTIKDLTQEYVHTTREWPKSKWDFGPIFNSFNYNEQEGVRLRIGGMTTANLHPNFFLSTYIAYGFADKRPKGGLNLTYSFNQKNYHPYENLRHYLTLTLQYDIEELGQSYAVVMRDHVLMSVKFNYETKPEYYAGRIKLKYEKEWANEFSVITWGEFINNQPNGSILRPNQTGRALFYNRINPDGSLTNRPFYHDAQWVFQLRYSPGGYIYNDRQGEESPFNLWKDAPVFRFTNRMGYILEDGYFYNTTELSAEKRIWFSAFGHLDLTVNTGYVWTKSPYTKLFAPVTNQSILLDPRSFHMMRPVEFMMDRYVSLYSTYYFKGWILNRIPGINILKLRGVTSFQLLAGYCGERNNPYAGTAGIYEFPISYYRDGQPVRSRTDFSWGKMSYIPYMELTVGIENIFNLLRIDYVRRLTHTDGLSGWQLNGVRLTLRAAI